MKFPNQELSEIEQIDSEECDSFTDELCVIVLKENFINCQYQVEEIKGISLKELDYQEDTFKVKLSLVVQKLLQLGFDFSNYQMFYKAKNMCFVYVGVFPNLSDVYVPMAFPKKVLIKIRQSLQYNSQDQIKAYNMLEQNQSNQDLQKEANNN